MRLGLGRGTKGMRCIYSTNLTNTGAKYRLMLLVKSVIVAKSPCTVAKVGWCAKVVAPSKARIQKLLVFSDLAVQVRVE